MKSDKICIVIYLNSNFLQISLKFTSDFITWYKRNKMGCTNSKKNTLDQYDTNGYPDIINKSYLVY